MAWGDLNLDIIADACAAAQDNLPAWKAGEIQSRILDQAAHDINMALSTAKEVLE